MQQGEMCCGAVLLFQVNEGVPTIAASKRIRNIKPVEHVQLSHVRIEVERLAFQAAFPPCAFLSKNAVKY